MQSREGELQAREDVIDMMADDSARDLLANNTAQPLAVRLYKNVRQSGAEQLQRILVDSQPKDTGDAH